jgi:predicted nucleic acid-binding protein
MIRAVIDTNIFLSALRSQDGASFQIVDRLERGEFTLVLSQTVLAEYEEVLKRELMPLGYPISAIELFLDDLCRCVEIFRPSGFWKIALPDRKLIILSLTTPVTSLPTAYSPFRLLIRRHFWTYYAIQYDYHHCQYPRFSGTYSVRRSQEGMHIGRSNGCFGPSSAGNCLGSPRHH